MNNLYFWLLKINALLHDPPDKSLDIKGHKGQAENWARTLGINLFAAGFDQADWIASAADRLNFPSYRKIGSANFRNKPYLTHPLAGVRLNLGTGRFLPTQINDEELKIAIQESLKCINPKIKTDYKKLFLWLWRNWAVQIQQTDGNQLGVLWDLLPADTRIPDHSIWAHQALTSAIAATKPDAKSAPNPAFLLFTIGPVQAFISAARRTQDLWAGSYLLSYLNWAAIEVIAENIGPDAVIFPNLLGQPLCDRWLYTQGILPALPQTKDLVLPSLPNRFLAIVPANQGADLAKQAVEKMRSQWREISQSVREDVQRVLGFTPNWSETWERQTENLFETYWQVYPWRYTDKEPIQDNNFHRFLNPHKPYLGNRAENTEKILSVYRDDADTYRPNLGSIYSDLYFITEKSLGSRKGLRDFAQVDETGEKSTLGGDRAALYDGVDAQTNVTADCDRIGRKNIRSFWQQLSQRLGSNQIQPKGKERLDAVELTKRCAWQFYFEKQPGFNSEDSESELRFPSTNNIASASFKDEILTHLQQPGAEPLRTALEAWVYKVERITSHRINPNVIPYLAAKAKKSDRLLEKFLRLDGRLLFIETYEDSEEFEPGVNFTDRKIASKALQYFLKVANQDYSIPRPRKYFAILMMDGDNMGKWLNGEQMPNYEQVLHPDTKQALEQREDWQKILHTPRLMSPAIHGFISKALGDFSLKLARHIVENRYPGKLVYAGGDDVLALLPLDSALKVARELRAAFSGEVKTNDAGEDFQVSFGSAKTGYVWLKLPDEEKPRLLATMGHKATASTGIAIAHRLAALDLTLQEVRQAEKRAKNFGRNAFGLTFLKRSGEIMTTEAKWTYTEKPTDTVQVLLDFQAKFAAGEISSKFPYILRTEAETLATLNNKELYTAEIKRLLARQEGNRKRSTEDTKDTKDIKNLASELADLAMQVNLKKIAELLIFTRFLATGEGEEN